MMGKIIFKFVLFLLFCWPSLVVAKYQVCAITINSSDEIEIFQKELGNEDFDFVELVPTSEKLRLNSQSAALQPNNVHWFTKACKKGYRCDILVISGHFGGLFFGEKHNYILPVDTMERHSCSRSCAGVLSHVKEVFLFGCYTLANKQSRQRTPQQHLNVLVNTYHYARDMAETVVASIYLPFGLSFETQMQWIFPYQSSIYGFPELSPLGKHMRRPLKHYFREINRYYGSYKSYLDQKMERPQASNPLISALGAVSEVKGIGPNNEQFPYFQRMCHLYDQNVDKKIGMQIINEMMESGEGPRAYLAIKNFISENRPFTGESLSLFNKIKNNPKFKNEFYILYDRINSRLPYVRIQFLRFLSFFEWVSEPFYKKELKSNTLRMVRRPTSEGYDFAMALVYDEKIPLPFLNLSSRDFHPRFYQNIWSALILETLNVRDYLAHRRLMNACLSKITKDVVVCYQVLKSLGHLKVNDSLIIDKMVEFLDVPDYGLIYYSIYGLAYSGVQKSSVHLAVARHFNHPEKRLRRQSIRAVGLLKSKNPQVNKKLVDVVRLSKDDDIIADGLLSLKYMSPPIKSIRQVIVDRKFYDHPNEEIKALARSF